MNSILENLKNLIGSELDEVDVICCFPDDDRNVILSKVEGYTSNFDEYGICQLFNVYFDDEESELYNIWVDVDNIIVYVD